jgi:hypothetical protein
MLRINLYFLFGSVSGFAQTGIAVAIYFLSPKPK